MEDKLNMQKLYYQQVVTIWEGFCELHRELYEFACEEYLALLASDIDKIETILPKKEAIVAEVSRLETERADLIRRLNSSALFDIDVYKASDLLAVFEEFDLKSSLPLLKNLNDLLIDIIEKLQEQNKKNQIFLNKAMMSIREIRQGFTGKKSYTTYGADGMTRAIGR